MVDFKEMILQEEVGKNEEDIDIKNGDTKEEKEDRDVGQNIDMSETPFHELKRTCINLVVVYPR